MFPVSRAGVGRKSPTDGIAIITWSQPVFKNKKASPKRCIFGNTGNDLGFRLVSKQVCSALEVFTSVFGMRTGVTPLLKSPVMVE